MTSKGLSWRQIYVKKFGHEVKNMSWCRKCFQKSSSWCQKHVMMTKGLLWRQKFAMKSKIYPTGGWGGGGIYMSMTSKTRFHNILFSKWWWKKMSGLYKSWAWRQKYVMTTKTRHDVKRFVMASKVCHEVKNITHINNIKNTFSKFPKWLTKMSGQ